MVPGVLQDFRPDLVLYDAGVDPHQDDKLGRLSLTDSGLMRRELQVDKQQHKLHNLLCTSVLDVRSFAQERYLTAGALWLTAQSILIAPELEFNGVLACDCENASQRMFVLMLFYSGLRGGDLCGGHLAANLQHQQACIASICIQHSHALQDMLSWYLA